LSVAIEKFGTLPERLKFTQSEWISILALHSLEQKMYDKCPRCANRDKHAVRKCFYCGEDYTDADRSQHFDDGDGRRQEGDGDGAMRDAVDRMLSGQPGASTAHGLARERAAGDKTKEEQRAEAKAAFAKTQAQG